MAEKEANKYLIDTYLRSFPGDAANILSSFPEENTIDYLKGQPAEIAGGNYNKNES